MGSKTLMGQVHNIKSNSQENNKMNKMKIGATMRSVISPTSL